MQDFIDYVISFYGVGGIYDFGATEEEIKKAIEIRMDKYELPFAGDSVDREMVRDIIVEQVRDWPVIDFA